MSVEIDPMELGFRRPFTVEVSQVLKLRNTNSHPVAFKVKTTAPKQYCVRPNSGRIDPDHDVEVTVLLQAMKQDPPMDQKCRDKFLVQSVPISGDQDLASVQEIWDSVEKSSVQEKKIRVTFLPADGKPGMSSATPVRHSLTNGDSASPDAPPPAYSSPGVEDTISSTAPISNEHSPEAYRGTDDSPSVVSGATMASAKDTTLKEKLTNPEIMISSIKEKTGMSDESSGGLRQRKGLGASGSGSTATAQLQETVRQGTEGVPVQIVAALCLVSFLLAYFFF